MNKPANNLKDEKLVEDIKNSTAPFINELLQKGLFSPLSVAPIQRALLAALVSQKRSVTLIADVSLKKSQQLFETINHWTQIVNINARWHFIIDELTPPERSGAISTPTSLAYHYLLFKPFDKPSSFVIAHPALEQALPDPLKYAELITTFVTGDTVLELSEIVKTLSERGFVRHTASVEPGTLRVRGDQLEIAHPLLSGYYAINFNHRTIESITHFQERRSVALKNLQLPPMRFPNESVPWSAVLAELTLLQFTVSNISEALQMPWKDEWLTLLPTPVLPTDQPIQHDAAYELLGQLTVGKPAVHRDHGVGIYEGLHKRVIQNQEREYLVLRYAEGDSLSVPVEFAHKVTPYIGDATPSLHRLGGTLWTKARKAATAEARRLAQELLKLAQARSAQLRTPYVLQGSLEDLLDTTCAFELTTGQRTAWEDVRSDLEQPQPMDRLIIGDVGYGKTEVAQRAAAHAVQNGQQVAVIAPTTLLVQQHADTFADRLQHVKNKIGLLSRFVSNKQQKQVKKGIEDGSIMIAIGTHALLSKSLQWKNLGLIIIDEEQRFGVKQKEHFKHIRSTVDVLSLSATPIPRTLSMALTGLRQLSVISTPPPDRKSVKTVVTGEDDVVLKEALQRELGRGGQVYIVAPKIKQLASIKHHVQELIPQARLEIAHGQMDSKDLAHIMHRFDARDIDILVSSSIVENGLDLPNANTMIVFYAPHFGLSDLYQLRGRVGRRKRQGHALFLYPPRPLTSIQRQRLTALIEASRLGSGWDIARHDLEIRGAGNLLGAEQSGSVNTVGLQLYLDLIHEASAETTIIARHEVDIELPLPIILPSDYIADLKQRTQWYTRLSRAESRSQLDQRFQELENEYGELPQPVKNLKLILTLQHVAAEHGIYRLATELIKPPSDDPYYRLTVKANDIPTIISRLGDLGAWAARKDSITLTVRVFTPHLIERLIELLSKSAS